MPVISHHNPKMKADVPKVIIAKFKEVFFSIKSKDTNTPKLVIPIVNTSCINGLVRDLLRQEICNERAVFKILKVNYIKKRIKTTHCLYGNF